MKISSPIIVQSAVWVAIWVLFVSVTNPAWVGPNFYWLITLRVLKYALLYNVAYYALLPLFFRGKKRAFYLLSILAFLTYIGLSVALDLTLSQPQRTEQSADTQRSRRSQRARVFFLLFPPTLVGLAAFGVAATIRGFAAFEEQKKAEQAANRRRLEAEIALLKSQINPHFLLNTLNNLYALSLTAPDKTPPALYKLSEMVSYILYECASPQVPLRRDLEFIENYIELQRLRLSPNVELRVELPKAPPEQLTIEPMVLIPFIENAFKHGLTTKGACDIHIAIRLDGNRLTMVVDNRVLPPKPTQEGHPSGVGLTNTRQRLAHSYPGRHELRITEAEDRHHVKLELDLT
jgi:signal transduction histidine kinase